MSARDAHFVCVKGVASQEHPWSMSDSGSQDPDRIAAFAGGSSSAS